MTVRVLIPLALDEEIDPAACVAAGQAAAASIEAPFDVLVLAAPTQRDAAEQAGTIALDAGAQTLRIVEHAAIRADATPAQAAHALAVAFVESGASPTRITLLPACPAGEEIAALLAVRTGGSSLGRVIGVARDGERLAVRRAAFGGRVQATLATGGAGFGVMRPPGEAKVVSRTGTIERLTLAGDLPNAPAATREPAPAGERRLEGAKLVVSGGRGIGGPEGFEPLLALARALGGALGGSLPTVDAGWMPVARQVGQSGKYVSPAVYVAVAISGTPQHMAGIAPATRIVAINNDPEAPIFKRAEIGCVGDWKAIVPALLARLEAIE